MKEELKYGECAKHPGNNMVNCIYCKTDIVAVPVHKEVQPTTPKEVTAMTEFIANAITARENSKDGYVTYDEVIEVATSLLTKERERDKKIAGEAFDAGRERQRQITLHTQFNTEYTAPDKQQYIDNLFK